ncbi:1-(5-phosphoribosyl)-5-[(5-phosphoribosylamino)methylideneamino]imidazole-4-carboxamide isomerase [Desmospora activa]|uniref:1-(5-phosphoribosyl)-5-[(5-phosphoribosylamino)methylideneamino] imidazole-4-carboxamide isomerase n=1 Tax=Desmospora activa DSM 45169 TaxID=1121389 RepID=A0A2T4Z451_9BACL|nr:1-(5-phosphoribosyl)-5-[(5-phosphoribosylamino)methylideneamino]imidazole-4-carboxamide isomerase [Desmospora activa]PTM56635.1 1-(5-phosphoribosyl)-5-[(5-phosphoribosylamino)methylideneamino] imidazole-4-carboxamide isomerase [Desmospora activa DSM 45169]
MTFTLYPAIDLRGGNCVRLFQGDYARETVYDTDPVAVVRRFVDQGAEWLHVVDLDAARTGVAANLEVIKKMAAAAPCPLQVGGGVRDMERLRQLLDAGVQRVVIGSAAVDNPAFVKEALASFGDRIAVGLDARDGMVATHGWLDTSNVPVERLANEMAALGAETFIFTDIARDGTLSGPNVDAIRFLAQACGRQVIASGGVRSSADLTELARYAKDGVAGAIVGKALYTGAIRLKEALQAVEKEAGV